MKKRGWKRLGVGHRVMFRLGAARLNWGEAVEWLTTCGMLSAIAKAGEEKQ